MLKIADGARSLLSLVGMVAVCLGQEPDLAGIASQKKSR